LNGAYDILHGSLFGSIHEDKRIWKIDKQGKYLVKGAYHLFFDNLFFDIIHFRNGNNQGEKSSLCDAKFSSATSLVDHAKKVHQRNGSKRYGVKKVSISACPKCSKGFLDPVSLVEHVERDHGGSS
jgi:hypothetical protein